MTSTLQSNSPVEIATLTSTGIQAGWYHNGETHTIIAAHGDRLVERGCCTYSEASDVWEALRRTTEGA